MSLFWDWLYLFKKTPWDTGITPPEIVALIERQNTDGRALIWLRHRTNRSSRAAWLLGGDRCSAPCHCAGETQSPIGAAGGSGGLGAVR
jgi:hypothetical protein